MGLPPTCECGTCRKCKRREYMRAYYARNAEKIRETARRTRLRHIEKIRAYDRARGYRRPGEEKRQARKAVEWAVGSGRLVRQPCEVCDASPTDAHHDDYSKPLDVRWLCRQHHMELHRTIVPY